MSVVNPQCHLETLLCDWVRRRALPRPIFSAVIEQTRAMPSACSGMMVVSIKQAQSAPYNYVRIEEGRVPGNRRKSFKQQQREVSWAWGAARVLLVPLT